MDKIAMEFTEGEVFDLIFFLKAYGGEREHIGEWIGRRESPFDLADKFCLAFRDADGHK